MTVPPTSVGAYSRHPRDPPSSGGDVPIQEEFVSDQLHPMAPHHLPLFITAPGETDVWMVVMGVFSLRAHAGGRQFLSAICTRCRNGWRTSRRNCSSRSSLFWDCSRSSPMCICSGSRDLLLALDRSSGLRHAVAQHRGFGGEDRGRRQALPRQDRTKPKATSAAAAGKVDERARRRRGAQPCLSCCSARC